MAWAFEIELGNWVETIVNYEPSRTISWTKVYANEKSVRQSEYYDGVAAGRKPEIVYEIRSFEFDNHEKVRVETKIYDIVRTYKKNEILELTLAAAVV